MSVLLCKLTGSRQLSYIVAQFSERDGKEVVLACRTWQDVVRGRSRGAVPVPTFLPCATGTVVWRKSCCETTAGGAIDCVDLARDVCVSAFTAVATVRRCWAVGDRVNGGGGRAGEMIAGDCRPPERMHEGGLIGTVLLGESSLQRGLQCVLKQSSSSERV